MYAPSKVSLKWLSEVNLDWPYKCNILEKILQKHEQFCEQALLYIIDDVCKVTFVFSVKLWRHKHFDLSLFI